MGNFVCEECNMDCKTKLAYDKHMQKQHSRAMKPKYEFTSPFDNAVRKRCPKCSDAFKSYWIKDEMTYVCLNCGLHFTPSFLLDNLRAELKKIEFKRK